MPSLKSFIWTSGLVVLAKRLFPLNKVFSLGVEGYIHTVPLSSCCRGMESHHRHAAPRHETTGVFALPNTGHPTLRYAETVEVRSKGGTCHHYMLIRGKYILPCIAGCNSQTVAPRYLSCNFISTKELTARLLWQPLTRQMVGDREISCLRIALIPFATSTKLLA
jgi:hypothetical protein